jgi:hypothetical protein
MAFPRCCLAEWQIVRARLLRSRLGIWLLLLAAGFAWLAAGAARDPLLPLALRTGMLSAILCVAFSAGSSLDRAALALTLSHPTTPLAVAAGRWLAATVAAGLVTLAATFAVAALRGAGPGDFLPAAAAGAGAAGAAAGCALLIVWIGGNAPVGAFFFFIAVLSVLSPRGLEFLTSVGVIRVMGSAVLTLAPALWRYRGLAFGDPGAWLHAIAWSAGGVVLGAVVLARRRG